MGAWIETYCEKINDKISEKSHPTWVRGLKQSEGFINLMYNTSHPTWVRGLKQSVDVEKANESASHPTWVRGLKPVSSLSQVK